ncbi:hypothetical protein BJY16_002873 [Actinoplanes octamycinicus]|uniref:Uncharacterized protein n=1 Tax=Actinoplanes octamycinicus TaxID=135948 RepID=A0A7W7M728_9ACTN|nr:hypothetical protein [Actinoplanes octamycinicus]MBB4739414.1 hypothetical protein [Actinoplanes octamycinicus]GIE54599.1 hypothetical protein Aoc01nite_00010 [Actinoplanes octamycinicus]
MSDPGHHNPSPDSAPAADPPAPVTPEPAPAEPSGLSGARESDRHIEIQEAPFSLLGDSSENGSGNGAENGFGDPDPDTSPPTSRRKRTRTIVLASLLAVGLAGAAALGTFYWQIHSQRDTTLTLPPQIGELTLDTGENAQQTAEYLKTALSAEVDLDETVGAVYTAPADKNVLFFGGTTLFWSPDKDLDTSFSLISDEQGAVTNLHEVDPGPLSGTMKCGTTKTESGDLPVCGWADHGSLALAMFPNRPESEAAPLMRQLRAQIQTRN